ADEWIGIRPGTDGLFVMSMIRELLLTGRIDEEYLVRYTNVHWLVVNNPDGAGHGLYVRDKKGMAQCWDGQSQALAPVSDVNAKPILSGEVTLPDGRKAVPSFQVMVEHFTDEQYAPEAVAAKTGIAAADIRRIAHELADVAFEQSIELDIEWTDSFGRKHATKLRHYVHGLAFVFPLIVTLALSAGSSPVNTVFSVLAAISAAIGIGIERWLFFAEAKHVITLYYGAKSA
ncbi:MAG: hypothetical protein VW338_16250, partial [Rhodospirillaceae bacterium]